MLTLLCHVTALMQHTTDAYFVTKGDNYTLEFTGNGSHTQTHKVLSRFCTVMDKHKYTLIH